jgi:hypothetical protein
MVGLSDRGTKPPWGAKVLNLVTIVNKGVLSRKGKTGRPHTKCTEGFTVVQIPVQCSFKGIQRIVVVTVSPSPQSKDEENEKLHKLREYARDFRRQHTTDAEQFDWDSDDGDYGLAIGRLVVT